MIGRRSQDPEGRVTAVTRKLLRRPNTVSPNANRALASFLEDNAGRIRMAVAVSAEHGPYRGVVGPAQAKAGRGLLGLRSLAEFDTLYIYTDSVADSVWLQSELHCLFYESGLHGYLGSAMRFAEISDETERVWGVRPGTSEAIFVRWGYHTARSCDSSDFSE